MSVEQGRRGRISNLVVPTQPTSAEDISGPYDSADALEHHRAGLVDFGSLLVPVPTAATARAWRRGHERWAGVHIEAPTGYLRLHVLAAPRSNSLWAQLAKDIAASLEQKTQVSWERGQWGLEVVSATVDELTRFIGVDGPRWTLYGVTTGPHERTGGQAAVLRSVIRGTVVVRGDSPFPVSSELPLTDPDSPEPAGPTPPTPPPAASAPRPAEPALSALPAPPPPDTPPPAAQPPATPPPEVPYLPPIGPPSRAAVGGTRTPAPSTPVTPRHPSAERATPHRAAPHRAAPERPIAGRSTPDRPIAGRSIGRGRLTQPGRPTRPGRGGSDDPPTAPIRLVNPTLAGLDGTRHRLQHRLVVLEAVLGALDRYWELIPLVAHARDRTAAVAAIGRQLGVDSTAASAIVDLSWRDLTAARRRAVAAEYQELRTYLHGDTH